MSFRLLSYNIRHGGTGREEAIAEVVSACRPDLVVFQEATRPRVIETLAARCGMAECGALPRTSLGYMSREPTRHHAWHRPRLSRHAFLEVHPGGVNFRVFGVHLSAVHAAWTERRRVLELGNLLRTIQAHEEGFHLLTGDFNTLAPGELLEVRKLPRRLRALVWLSGGRIRWRTVQMVLNAGYVDGFRRLHPDDAGLTFPVWDPHVRLDYVFLPAGRAEGLLSCEVIRHPVAHTASDHFPLLAELALSASSSSSS
ncbi:MAG: endonuclease/exonuclease/phosphatase family protein [Acidobacteria bacterium]|nr:endonuclease/exonuclease/phosphatase family protein [Acidobacteriota bacterium]